MGKFLFIAPASAVMTLQKTVALIATTSLMSPIAILTSAAPATAEADQRIKPCFCSYDVKSPEELAYCKNNQFARLEGLSSWRCDPVNLFPLKLDSFRLADQGGNLDLEVTVKAADELALIVVVGGTKEVVYDTARILQWGAGRQVSEYTSSQAMSTGMAVGTILFGIPGLVAGGLIGSAPRYTVDEAISFLYLSSDGSREVVTLKNDPSASSSNHSRLSNLIASGTGIKAGVLISEQQFNARLLERRDVILERIRKLAQTDPVKPWCSKKPSDPLKARRYEQLVAMLGEQPAPPVVNESQDPWLAYLSRNPEMKKWADANPVQAAKIQNCRF